MTTSPAGWYPDPAGSGGTRWWDGTSWGEHVQPAAQPVAAGRPWQPAGQPWGAGVPQQGTAAEPDAQTFLQQNKSSLIALALVVVCVLIAATTHTIVFAFVPAVVAAQAVVKKEPLAWPALGIGLALVVWRFIA